MNLREQEYICAIAKNRSVTKAAKELNITQAALSLFVQNLEKRLDVRLFERYKKEMVPTVAGEMYIASAEKILREGECFMQHLQSFIDNGEGRIRFGINSKRSPMVVPHLLPKMRKVYPNVQVIVKESDTRQLVTMLQNNELDCVYTYEKVEGNVIHSEQIGYDRIGLILSNKNKQMHHAIYDKNRQGGYIDLACLKDETFLLYENDETRVDFDRLTAAAGFKARIQEYYNVETMLELADQDYGILYMNEMYMQNFHAIRGKHSLRFLMVGQQDKRLEVFLSYHQRMLDQDYGNTFLDIIREL